jgi:hypothetical protein
MKVIIGLALVIAVVLMVLANGVMLLISPSRWFSMPAWIRLQGTITRSRYSGWVGELPLRLFGAELIAAILWAGYEFLRRPEPSADSIWNLEVPSVILRLFLCIGVGITGALMVLKPRWMFDQYWEPRLAKFRPKIGGERQDLRDHLPISFFSHLMSTLGLIAVALACFLTWALFR